MISFGSGAPGGIFLPLLVMGAIIGSIYYNAALLVSPSLSGLVGISLSWHGGLFLRHCAGTDYRHHTD